MCRVRLRQGESGGRWAAGRLQECGCLQTCALPCPCRTKRLGNKKGAGGGESSQESPRCLKSGLKGGGDGSQEAGVHVQGGSSGDGLMLVGRGTWSLSRGSTDMRVHVVLQHKATPRPGCTEHVQGAMPFLLPQPRATTLEKRQACWRPLGSHGSLLRLASVLGAAEQELKLPGTRDTR